MRVSPRAARGLAAAGLAGCLVWSVVTEAARPSWFDLDDSCPGAASAETSYFPPRATCSYDDGRSITYLPVMKTVVLTIVLVFLVAVTVTGLAVLGRQLLRPVVGTAPRRPVLHVLGAAVLGTVVCAIGRAVILLALLIGGPPGGVTVFVLVVLAALEAATALESAFGTGSRRRATVLVLTSTAATIALVCAEWDAYAERNTLLGPGWTIAACGGVFAVLATAQWLTSRVVHADRSR